MYIFVAIIILMSASLPVQSYQWQDSPIDLSEYQDAFKNKLTPDDVQRYINLVDQIEYGIMKFQKPHLDIKSPLDEERELSELVNKILSEKHITAAETFFFHVIVRTREVIRIMRLDSNSTANYMRNFRIAFLKDSLKFALSYYRAHDKLYLHASDESAPKDVELPLDFINFGNDYFKFLNSQINDIIHLENQYHLTRLSLQLLQWDLHRDVNANANSESIIQIDSLLNNAPASVDVNNPKLSHYHLRKMMFWSK